MNFTDSYKDNCSFPFSSCNENRSKSFLIDLFMCILVYAFNIFIPYQIFKKSYAGMKRTGGKWILFIPNMHP